MEFNSIEVKDHSVIQRKYSLFNTIFKEIPRNKITSISSGYGARFWILILSLFSFIIGFGIKENYSSKIFLFGTDSFYFFIAIGIILMVVFIFNFREHITIKSPTINITEFGKGARKFHKRLREKLD